MFSMSRTWDGACRMGFIGCAGWSRGIARGRVVLFLCSSFGVWIIACVIGAVGWNVFIGVGRWGSSRGRYQRLLGGRKSGGGFDGWHFFVSVTPSHYG
jgi:hypothetical protein